MGSDDDTIEEIKALAHSPKGMSPAVLGAITFGVLLLYYWLSGLFLPEEGTGFWLTPAKATGSALTYATTPAFLLAATRAVGRRTRTMLIRLYESNTIDARAVADTLNGTGFSPTFKQNVIVTFVGLFLGAGFNVPWHRVLAEIDTPTAFAAAGIVVGNLITWLAVSHTGFRRIAMSNSIRNLGRRHAKIDLFRLEALLPFGRMGTFDLLVVVIAMSFAVFQSLDAQLLWENYSSAISAGVPIGVGLLMMPMLGIRQNVRLEKHRAIEQVNELITNASRELDPESMRYLGDLLRRREQLEKVHEWPLDMTTLSRIAIYFVVPPLAWLGGALVEIVVNAAIGSG